MRPNFREAALDLQSLHQHRQLLAIKPISPQESFLQVLINLALTERKEAIDNPKELLSAYEGPYTSFQLLSKYAVHAVEKGKAADLQNIAILTMLAKWVEVLEQLNAKKDVKLYESVVELAEKGLVSYEGFILYLNYISLDIIGILRTGSEDAKKKYPDLSRHPHLDCQDLIKFIKVVLPKTLSNIVVPRSFFPATLIQNCN